MTIITNKTNMKRNSKGEEGNVPVFVINKYIKTDPNTVSEIPDMIDQRG